jgi:hypothetical protein
MGAQCQCEAPAALVEFRPRLSGDTAFCFDWDGMCRRCRLPVDPDRLGGHGAGVVHVDRPAPVTWLAGRYRCSACGCFWRLWPGEGGWSLYDADRRACVRCDNSPEFLSLLEMAPDCDDFASAFDAFAVRVFNTACEKGWWDGADRNDGELIALMHSELSEALEGLRAGNPPDEKLTAFLSTEVEYADVVIRIMDHAVKRGWRVGAAIVAKAEYNKSRPVKHGGKRF